MEDHIVKTTTDTFLIEGKDSEDRKAVNRFLAYAEMLKEGQKDE